MKTVKQLLQTKGGAVFAVAPGDSVLAAAKAWR